MPPVTVRAQYVPFGVNSREAIAQAIDVYRASRRGVIPADQVAPRNYS